MIMPFLTAGSSLVAVLFYRYKMKELEVRASEARSRLAQTRLLTGAPAWLDPDDPADIEAWRKSRGELGELLLTQRRGVGEDT